MEKFFKKGRELVSKLKPNPLRSERVLKYEELSNFVWNEAEDHSYYEDSEGGKYYPVIKNPENQFFVSKILKPFLKVHEVLIVQNDSEKPYFFSYAPPNENYNPEETFIEKDIAQKVLVGLVFQDFDREIYDLNSRHNQSYLNGHNLLWDFEESWGHFWRVEREEFIRQFKLAAADIESLGASLYKTCSILSETCKEMIDFLEPESGYNFLEEVLKKVNIKNMNQIFLKNTNGRDYEFTEIYDEILNRLRLLKRLSELEMQ